MKLDNDNNHTDMKFVDIYYIHNTHYGQNTYDGLDLGKDIHLKLN